MSKLKYYNGKEWIALDGAPGLNGKDGRTPSTSELVAIIKSLIPDPIPGPPGKDGAAGPAGSSGRALVGWGAHPLQIHDASGVIDKVARTLKFTGATVTRAHDGMITVGISGSGFTELASTETPNGATTVFTFSAASAKPSYIVTDNVWVKSTSKSGTINWTWDNATKKATMSIPPNDDIYGIV